MIKEITLKNFGPLKNINWNKLSNINLILGNNNTGKTFLLKALYSAMKTIEEYKRGNEIKSVSDILVNKLYWTFQSDNIGKLVTKGAVNSLYFEMNFDDKKFAYQYGKDTTKQILSIENHVSPRTSNSIFLPAREVLSLQEVILKSRDRDKIFGFDDTYLDLIHAISIDPTYNKNNEFTDSRKQLENMTGKIKYDGISRWYFKKGKHKFCIGDVSDSSKKISTLNILLSNGYLNNNSIIFIDEIESTLHPTNISKLLDIIEVLATNGIQFFITSQSYYLILKMYYIARKKKLSIPTISLIDDNYDTFDFTSDISTIPFSEYTS